MSFAQRLAFYVFSDYTRYASLAGTPVRTNQCSNSAMNGAVRDTVRKNVVFQQRSKVIAGGGSNSLCYPPLRHISLYLAFDHMYICTMQQCAVFPAAVTSDAAIHSSAVQYRSIGTEPIGLSVLFRCATADHPAVCHT